MLELGFRKVEFTHPRKISFTCLGYTSAEAAVGVNRIERCQKSHRTLKRLGAVHTGTW